MWEALIWYLKAEIAIDLAAIVFALIMGLLYGVLNHYLSRSKTVQEALHKYSGGAKNYYAKVMRNAENYKGRD